MQILDFYLKNLPLLLIVSISISSLVSLVSLLMSVIDDKLEPTNNKIN